MASNLPLVGAHAVILGMSAFNANARQVVFQLADLERATTRLAKESSVSWDLAARAAELAMSKVSRAASMEQKAIAEVKAAEAAALKAGAAAQADAAEAQAKAQEVATKALQTAAAEQAVIQAQMTATAAAESNKRAQLALQEAQARAAGSNNPARVLAGPTAAAGQAAAGQALADTGLAEAQRRAAALAAELKIAQSEYAKLAAAASASADVQIAAAKAVEAAQLRLIAARKAVVMEFGQKALINFSNELQQINSLIEGITRLAVVSATVSGVIAAGLTATVIALGIAAVKAGASYTEVMTQVQALTVGSVQEMKALDSVIEKIGTTTSTSMTDAAKGAAELAKGGTALADISAGALTAANNLKIASAGELTMSEAAKAVSVALQLFHMEGSRANEVANAIAATAQQSSISFGDLKSSLSQAGEVAANLHYTLADTTAMLGVMGQAGLKGSDAGTSLRTALQHLEKPSKQAIQWMKDFGVSLYDVNGAARPARDVVIGLQNAFSDQAIAAKGISQAQRDWALQTIFGTDGARAMIAVIRGGVQAFDEMTAAQKNLTAQKIAEQFMLPLNAQFDILGNNINRVATRFGEALIPLFAQATGAAITFLQNIPTQGIYALGQAINAVASGGGLGQLQVLLTAAFGEQTAGIIAHVANIFINVGQAIGTMLIPAVQNLGGAFATLAGASSQPLANVYILTNNIAIGFRNAIAAVSNFINVVAGIVTAISRNEAAVQALHTILQGLLALPLIGIATVFLSIAGAIAQAALAAAAIGAIVQNWSSIRPVIESIAEVISNNLTQAVIAAGLVLVAFGTVQAMQAVAGMYALATSCKAAIEGTVAVAGAMAALGARAAAWAAQMIAAAATVLANNVKTAASFLAIAVSAVAAFAQSAAAAAVHAAVQVAQGAKVVATFLTIGATSAIMRAQAVGAMTTAAAAAIAFAITQVATAKASVAALLQMIAAFIATRIAAVASFAAMAGATIASLAASAAAIVPFIAVVALIGAAAYGILQAWQNNFFNIQTITQQVLQWIADKIKGFLDWARSALGAVGIDMDAVGGAFSAAGGTIARVAGDAGTAVRGLEGQARALWAAVNQPLPDMSQFNQFTNTTENLAGELPNLDSLLQQVRSNMEGVGGAAQQAGNNIAGTAPAVQDFGDGGANAAKKFASAVEKLNELLKDTQTKLQNLADDTGEKITAIGTKYATRTYDIMKQHALDMAKQWQDAAEKVKDIQDNLATTRSDRERKREASEVLEDVRTARQRLSQEEEAWSDRDLEIVRRQRQQETDAAYESFKDQEEIALESTRHQIQLAEEAEQKKTRALKDALNERQQAESRALQQSFEAANRARNQARDDRRATQQAADDAADAARQLARDLANAKTPEDRAQVQQRAAEQAADRQIQAQRAARDRAQARAEADQDAATQKAQQAASDALKRQQQKQDRQLQDSEEEAATQRKIANDKKLKDAQRESEKRLREERNRLDDIERDKRFSEDISKMHRRFYLEDQEKNQRRSEDRAAQAEDDRIEDARVATRIANIWRENTQKASARQQDTADKLAQAAEDARKELQAEIDRFNDRRRAILQHAEDVADDVRTQIGPAIEGQISQVMGAIQSGIAQTDSYVLTFIEHLNEALAKANQVANTPNNTYGAGQVGAAPIQPGGSVGQPTPAGQGTYGNSPSEGPSSGGSTGGEGEGEGGGEGGGPSGGGSGAGGTGGEGGGEGGGGGGSGSGGGGGSSGGESAQPFVPMQEVSNPAVSAIESTGPATNNITTNIEYNIQASYTNPQDPATIAMDLRGLGSAVRR